MKKSLLTILILLVPVYAFGATLTHGLGSVTDEDVCTWEATGDQIDCDLTIGTDIAPVASPTFTGTATTDYLAVEGPVDFGTYDITFASSDPDVSGGSLAKTGGTSPINGMSGANIGHEMIVNVNSSPATWDCDGDLQCGAADLVTATGDMLWWSKVSASKWRLQSWYNDDLDYNTIGDHVAYEVNDEVVEPADLWRDGGDSPNDGDVPSYSDGNDEFIWISIPVHNHVTCHRIDTGLVTGTVESVYRAVAPRTVVSIWCETDLGTVDLDLEIDDGEPAGVNGSYIECPVSPGIADSDLAGDIGIGADEMIDIDINAIDTATRLTVCWELQIP